MLDVSVHPDSEGGFVEGSGSKVEDGLRGVFFGGRKAVAIHFEEQDTDDKARAFIPIDKGVVADNADSVSSSRGEEGEGGFWNAGRRRTPTPRIPRSVTSLTSLPASRSLAPTDYSAKNRGRLQMPSTTILPEQYSRHTENIAGYPVVVTSYRLWDTYYAKAEIALPGMGGWFARAEGSTQAGAEAKLLAEVGRLLLRTG